MQCRPANEYRSHEPKWVDSQGEEGGYGGHQELPDIKT